LHHISLPKPEGPTEAPKEVLAGKIIVESEVELVLEPKATCEENPPKGNKKESKDKERNNSKEPHVKESKKEKLRSKDDLYFHPHHLEK